MKLNPKFLKIMASITFIVCVSLLGLVYFDDDFIPNFPYKYTMIKQKSSEVLQKESDIQITKKHVDEWVKRIEDFKKSQELETPIENTYSEVIVKKMPQGIDYPSLLLFVEEQALLNDVIVSNINLNREVDVPEETTESGKSEAQESTSEGATEGAEETTVEPTTEPVVEHSNELAEFGVDQRAVEITVMGDYQKVETFIKSLSEDMGIYNFIEKVSLVRGKSEVIDWEKFKDESQIIIPNENDETIEETSDETINETNENEEPINKNIIVNIKMVINFKKGGVN